MSHNGQVATSFARSGQGLTSFVRGRLKSLVFEFPPRLSISIIRALEARCGSVPSLFGSVESEGTSAGCPRKIGNPGRTTPKPGWDATEKCCENDSPDLVQPWTLRGCCAARILKLKMPFRAQSVSTWG